jgi:hypothetical protein
VSNFAEQLESAVSEHPDQPAIEIPETVKARWGPA